MWLVFETRAFGQRSVKLVKLLQIRRHRIVLVCFARFAPAPSPIVLADARPSALLARAPYPIVLADAHLARPSALLALAPLPSANSAEQDSNELQHKLTHDHRKMRVNPFVV